MSGEPAPPAGSTPPMPPGGVPLGTPPPAPSPAPAARPTLGLPGTAGSPSAQPPVAPGPATPAPPAPAPPEIATPDGKPQWPEKFLRDGKPDPDSLLSSYRELERLQFKRREDLRVEVRKELETAQVEGVPASPADYTFTAVKLKDGRELGMDSQDPVFRFLATTAHELKVPQSKFQGYVEQFALAQLAQQPSWQTEAAALGEHADRRLDRANAWGRGRLSQQSYDVFASLPATAANIQLFEEIMELTGEPKFAMSQSGMIKESLTMDDVRNMMNDPKYWDPNKRDPQHVQRVQAALRRLNPSR